MSRLRTRRRALYLAPLIVLGATLALLVSAGQNAPYYSEPGEWERKLPEEAGMDPIGASNTWRWYGYENSWVTLDGLRMQSVSGGGHWGGGIFISALDLARFGLLTLRRGSWAGETILSEEWIAMATTPTAANRNYGFMNWFLNTDRQLLPSSLETPVLHAGGGVNLIYVSPDHDLVVVVRWIDGAVRDEFFKLVLAAIE